MIKSILNKLSEVEERFEEIEGLLSQPKITKDQNKYINLSKEYADLLPIMTTYKDFLLVQEALNEVSNRPASLS